MITITVAFTSTPTSMTVVETRTSISRRRECGHHPVFLVGGSLPCMTRDPQSGRARRQRRATSGPPRRTSPSCRRPAGRQVDDEIAQADHARAWLAVPPRSSPARPRCRCRSLGRRQRPAVPPPPPPEPVAKPVEEARRSTAGITRGDRRATSRQLGQRPDVQIAEDRHRHGPRDWRRGHHQYGGRLRGLVRAARRVVEPNRCCGSTTASPMSANSPDPQSARACRDDAGGAAGRAGQSRRGAARRRAGQQRHPRS